MPKKITRGGCSAEDENCKGGALIEDLSTLAVPFAILLAKRGLESMFLEKKKKKEKKGAVVKSKGVSEQSEVVNEVASEAANEVANEVASDVTKKVVKAKKTKVAKKKKAPKVQSGGDCGCSQTPSLMLGGGVNDIHEGELNAHTANLMYAQQAANMPGGSGTKKTKKVAKAPKAPKKPSTKALVLKNPKTPARKKSAKTTAKLTETIDNFLRNH